MIWPLSPSDARGLAENYSHLSERSRHLRFLSPMRELSPSMLQLLVDSVDSREHVALVLVVFPADGPDRAVGVGRLIRHPDEPSAADVAVTVDDAWQGRGVATAVLAELLRQRPEGVTSLRTEVAAENRASLAMLRRLGAMHTRMSGSGVYEVRIDLDPPAPADSGAPAD
jgi:acetyltransferase